MGRGPGGPKCSSWTRKEGAQLSAFFQREEARQRGNASGRPSDLTWMFTTDGEDHQQAHVAIGGAVHYLIEGLTAELVRKGEGAMPGQGTYEEYWVVSEEEVASDLPGAQRRVRGGSGDLQLRLHDGSTRWVSAKHVAPCDCRRTDCGRQQSKGQESLWEAASRAASTRPAPAKASCPGIGGAQPAFAGGRDCHGGARLWRGLPCGVLRLRVGGLQHRCRSRRLVRRARHL